MTKHFEKGKKDARRFDFREPDSLRDEQKKKKLKPVERTKYRQKGFDSEEESEW